MPGAKATQIETDRRIFIIQGWIINGVQDYLILKQCQQQFIKSDGQPIGLRQAKNYLSKAYQLWHEGQVADIDQQRALAIAGLQQDIRNMKDEYKGTPRGMAVINQIKKEIAKLQALYPAKKLMLQGDPENPIVPTNSKEIEDRIEYLLSKRDKSKK